MTTPSHKTTPPVISYHTPRPTPPNLCRYAAYGSFDPSSQESQVIKLILKWYDNYLHDLACKQHANYYYNFSIEV